MKKNVKVLQFIPWIICIVLAIALFFLVSNDRKKSRERVMQAQLEAQLQNGDDANASNSTGYNEKDILNKYAELVSALELHSFVCWGDGEMAGGNTDGSLPTALREVTNGYLLNWLSGAFGEVIENEKTTVPSMTVNSMGAINEGMDEILVRAGVDELEVGEWALISEEKEPVNIVLRNGNSGTALRFARQKETDFGQTEISGVKGTLIEGGGQYDDDHPRLAFLRDRVGDSFQVGLGTDIKIESATKYLGNIPIFFFEDDTVDTAGSVDEFVKDLERLVQRYTEIEDEDGKLSEELPYVVICTVDEDSELDDSLKEAFDDHYIRHDTYADDMTEEGYKELAQKVYEKLDEQGCFDEIRGKIAKATEELKSAKE